MLDAAVEAVLSDCADDATCARLFPGQGDELDQLAASFVIHSSGRHVRPWRRWWWAGFAGAPDALTVTNGFVD